MKKTITILSIICLICGNLIGAGILGIPVLSGIAGFWPSVGLMVIACIAMTYSALILTRRACEERNPLFNYPTLYAHQLGKIGKYLGTITNALILYGLLTAYIAGGSIILAHLFGMNSVTIWLTLSFFLVMTILTVSGVRIFEKFNLILMLILWTAFIIMIIIGDRHIHLVNLEHTDLAFILLAIPMIITAFHFHNLIPTLAQRVDYDQKTLYIAILFGMVIGFMVNFAWLLVGIGEIPLLGHHSLEYCYVNGIPANVAMDALIHSKLFVTASLVFSLLAILTSYVANGLGLVDFCKDLSITYLNIKNRWFPILLTFTPPLVIAFTYPHIFLDAIGIVGGIGIVILFGILPAIIDWQRGKRAVPLLFILLFSVILIIQILLDTHLLQFRLPG